MNPLNLNWTIEYYEENIEKCNSLLKSLDNYDDIPCINYVSLQNLVDGTLVRYRGMVQDMLNPEYYSPSYTVINTRKNESYEKSGKFRDISSCKADEKFKENETEVVPKERQVYFCIPIPGSNTWVEAKEIIQIFLCHFTLMWFSWSLCQGIEKHFKKEIERKESVELCKNLKRKTNSECLDDNHTSETSYENDVSTNEALNPSLSSNFKKSKTEVLDENGEKEKSEKITRSTGSYNLSNYFPFQKETGLPCIIKTYEDDNNQSNLILNNAVEVIGFLSLNPALEADWEDTDLEDKAIHPPPSLVPRIHAIFVNKLHHCNPLLKQNPTLEGVTELAEKARSEFCLILTQLFFEDTLAAEFFLCHLISRVYVRVESHTIGQFSLNLYNIKQKNFGRYLYDILQKLVTNSHYLPLSVDFLNESTFVPKKDYETNRLRSGILQLCDDTHLILDETIMNEGQLKNQGCLNVLALQRLIRDQEVQYDFGYYPVTYNANVPLLILSEGKSMFEADVKVKVKSNSSADSSLSENYEAVQVYLNEEICNKIRIYLTSIRLIKFELGNEMIDKIGEDYVSLRQSNEKVSSGDLHTLLVLSRLLASSHGRKSLTMEDWSKALEMESERKMRLAE